LKNKPGRHPKSAIKNPVYPGGKKGLDDFIKNNLRYPEEALKNKIQGTVVIDYDVDVFGDVTKTKVRHGIGYGCDEEALRIVKLLKFTKRKYQGLHVVFHQHININFMINTAQKPPAPAQTVRIVYTEKPKEPGQGSGLGYSINLDGNP
jgi:TonB family protein